MTRGLALITFIVCTLLVWLTVLGTDIYNFSFESDSSTADAAIVLGAGVWNGQPSPVFKERINHAIQLYQENKIQCIIFTGGIGANDEIPESVVASQYALAYGVAANDMYCETTSEITWENLQGAKQLVDQQQLHKVLIISDPLHMLRSVNMARDLGLEAYSSPTPTTRYTGFQSQIGFLLREVYFYSLYLLQKPFMPFTRLTVEMKIQSCS